MYHPGNLVARRGARLIGIAVVSFLISSCVSVIRPGPSPGTRVLGDIRGVILRGADQRVEFRQVSDVRWTADTLVITGVVDSPDRTRYSRAETISFPLDDVSYVLVRDFSPGRSFWASVGVGLATGAVFVLMVLSGA